MTHPQQAALAPAPSKYGFHCVLTDPDFANAIAAVTDALKVEGFGILTESGVQAILKAKLERVRTALVAQGVGRHA